MPPNECATTLTPVGGGLFCADSTWSRARPRNGAESSNRIDLESQSNLQASIRPTFPESIWPSNFRRFPQVLSSPNPESWNPWTMTTGGNNDCVGGEYELMA